MIVLTQILLAAEAEQMAFDVTLSLPVDLRIKSRLKVILDDGREAGLFLPRGKILRGDDVLLGDEGIRVKIRAANESVSTVYCRDPHLMARVCYHLGNRHVPLQIKPDWVRYQHDHVLDEMVCGLGAEVVSELAPFEPEDGAYGGANGLHSSGGHTHGSDNGGGASQTHFHRHGHHHAHSDGQIPRNE